MATTIPRLVPGLLAAGSSSDPSQVAAAPRRSSLRIPHGTHIQVLTLFMAPGIFEGSGRRPFRPTCHIPLLAFPASDSVERTSRGFRCQPAHRQPVASYQLTLGKLVCLGTSHPSFIEPTSRRRAVRGDASCPLLRPAARSARLDSDIYGILCVSTAKRATFSTLAIGAIIDLIRGSRGFAGSLSCRPVRTTTWRLGRRHCILQDVVVWHPHTNSNRSASPP